MYYIWQIQVTCCWCILHIQSFDGFHFLLCYYSFTLISSTNVIHSWKIPSIFSFSNHRGTTVYYILFSHMKKSRFHILATAKVSSNKTCQTFFLFIGVEKVFFIVEAIVEVEVVSVCLSVCLSRLLLLSWCFVPSFYPTFFVLEADRKWRFVVTQGYTRVWNLILIGYFLMWQTQDFLTAICVTIAVRFKFWDFQSCFLSSEQKKIFAIVCIIWDGGWLSVAIVVSCILVIISCRPFRPQKNCVKGLYQAFR